MEQPAEATGSVPVPKARPRLLFVFRSPGELSILLAAIFASAAVAGAKIAFAVVLGQIFELVSQLGGAFITPDTALARISTWCLVLTGLGAFKAFSAVVFMTCWIIHGEYRARSVRSRLFNILLTKKLAWIESRPKGLASITTALQTQTRELQLATAQLLGHICCDVFVCIGCIAVAFVKGWQLTLLLLTSVPMAFFLLSRIGKRLDSATQSQRQELSEAAQHATASLLAIDVVKAYSADDHEQWHYHQRLKRAMRHYVVQARAACAQMGVVKAWMVLLFVAGFWFGVFLVDRGLTTAGNVLTTFYAILIGFQSIESLGTQWLAIVKGMAAGASMESIAEGGGGDPGENDPTLEARGEIIPEKTPEDIELVDVSFAYPSNPDHKVVNRCSFFFPTREISFVVGKSGSGKSTVGDLLVKFYEPSSGKILFDGVSIDRIDTHWLRQNVTLVQQSSTAFSGSFSLNVRLGCENPREPNEDLVRQACETSLLQRTLDSLPDGLATVVGPHGHSLSGGQLQRLAFARAALRKTPVLILDEVTSGLEPASAKMILDAVRKWRKGMTTIIITHDIFEIEANEFVYVMDGGRVVQGGYYKTIARAVGGPLYNMLQSENGSGRSAALSPRGATFNGRIDTAEEKWLDDRMRVERWLAPRIDGQFTGNAMFKRMSLLAPISRGRQSSASLTARQSHIPKFPLQEKSSLEILQERGHHAQSQRAPRRQFSIAERATRETLPPETESNSTHSLADVQPVSLLAILGTVWPILNEFDRLRLIVGVACCLVVAAGNPIFSYFFARMLQAFWAPTNREPTGRMWAILLICDSLVDGAAVFGAFFMMERVGQAWVDKLRHKAFWKVLRQPKAWLDKPEHAPDRIIECLDRNAEEMRKLISVFLPTVLMAVIMVLSSVIWAFATSWNLTLVTLATGPAVVWMTRVAAKVSEKWETRSNKAFESTSGIFNEVFSSIRVVRALTLEKYFGEELEKSAAATFEVGRARAWRTGVVYGINQGIGDWLAALIFFYGVKLLTYPGAQLGVDNILQVVNLLLFSIGTATVMLGNIPQIAAAKAVATEMLYYASLDLRASHEHRPTGQRATSVLPIHFKKLQFRYPTRPEVPVLRSIGFSIRAGDLIAIVGPSGCGKSTILSLLLRLYEPYFPPEPRPMTPPDPNEVSWTVDEYPFPWVRPAQPAALTYDHTPARDLNTASLRDKMAYVPQRPVLFPCSVRDNIVYGLHDDSPLREAANVEAAASAAGLGELIDSLPAGYDTIIGDGGLRLSGGQSQRICIARALCRRPSLLVMDEPTSALDAETAGNIRRLMRDIVVKTPNTAIVVVTHSKEMMRIAEKIVVIDKGFVTATGCYYELVRRNEKFAEMVGDTAWSDETGRRESRGYRDRMDSVGTLRIGLDEGDGNGNGGGGGIFGHSRTRS